MILEHATRLINKLAFWDNIELTDARTPSRSRKVRSDFWLRQCREDWDSLCTPEPRVDVMLPLARVDATREDNEPATAWADPG